MHTSTKSEVDSAMDRILDRMADRALCEADPDRWGDSPPRRFNAPMAWDLTRFTIWDRDLRPAEAVRVAVHALSYTGE